MTGYYVLSPTFVEPGSWNHYNGFHLPFSYFTQLKLNKQYCYQISNHVSWESIWYDLVVLLG